MSDFDETLHEERSSTSSKNKDYEASRVAKLILYKDREKIPTKKYQLRIAQDQSKKDKNKDDIIQRADQILQDTLGFTIHVHKEDNNKNSNHKLYLLRDQEYPDDFEIPFSIKQKKQYGLLFYIFIFLYFRHGTSTIDAIWNVVERLGIDKEPDVYGKWPEIINTWSKQDYLQLKKVETDGVTTTEVSFGPRYHIEFGEELLVKFCKDITKK